MDLQMPVMDGSAAVGKLRGSGYGKPIIALTAQAISDARKKCKDLGFTDYLPKPIRTFELIETIRAHAKAP